MLVKKLIFLCAASVLLALPPTVTNCVVVSPDATSAQVYCDISLTNHYAAIEYGTAAATYTNRTPTKLSSGVAWARFALGGLDAGKVYYARMRAHPNASNLTDVGYSAEFTVTTTAEPTVNPTFPTAATEWTPTQPSIGAYTVVLMKRCSSGYPCADGAVASLGILNEDSLQTVINAATYGTVIRFPRGLDVNVQHNAADGNHGWNLHVKAVQAGKTGVDDPTHDWIILEAAGCSDTSYFPPYGSRIDATFSAVLPKFRATAKASVNRGQHFQVNNVSPHHYWLRCLEVDFPVGEAANVINPHAYRASIMIMNDFAPAEIPKYMVIDRVYQPLPAGTQRQYAGIQLSGQYNAVIGSDIRTGIWHMYSWPTGTATVGGAGNKTLTIPTGSTYQLRSTDAAQGLSSGGTVTVTSNAATGNWLMSLTGSTCKFYFDSRAIASISGTCTGVGAASDPTVTFPATEFTQLRGSVDATGAITIAEQYNHRDIYGAPIDNGGGSSANSFNIYINNYSAGPMTLSNNYLQANGLTFYIDGGNGSSQYDTTGVTRRNWFNLPRQWHFNHALTDGYRRANRQHWEIKRGNKWLVWGNLLTGAIAYQNISPSIFISGRGVYDAPTGAGINDIWVRSNTIAHGTVGWECSGNSGAALDNLPPRRILLENNLLYDLDRFINDETGSPAALNSAYFTSSPGCQGVRYRNNTHGASKGLGPYIHHGGGDDIRGGRLEMRDNIFYYSQGDSGCARHGVGFDDNPINATYPRIPALTATTTATAKFDSFFAKIGAGVTTANNSITNNLMIGGHCSTSSASTVDLTQTTVDAMAADFPTGNIWPPGATKAARESAAGLTSPSTYDFRLTAGSTYSRASADKFNPIGANLDLLKFEQGQVQDVVITPGFTVATARYLAPDTRACVFDVSSDAGVTWTRATDTGGDQRRTVSVTGLTAVTNYQYRIICYYQQLNDGRQWDDWPTSQLTTGTFTTGGSSTMTLSVSYSISSIPNATKARYTVYMGDGTSTVTTCTASPCLVAFTRNAKEFVIDALSAADVLLIPGARQKVVIQ